MEITVFTTNIWLVNAIYVNIQAIVSTVFSEINNISQLVLISGSQTVSVMPPFESLDKCKLDCIEIS